MSHIYAICSAIALPCSDRRNNNCGLPLLLQVYWDPSLSPYCIPLFGLTLRPSDGLTARGSGRPGRAWRLARASGGVLSNPPAADARRSPSPAPMMSTRGRWRPVARNAGPGHGRSRSRGRGHDARAGMARPGPPSHRRTSCMRGRFRKDGRFSHHFHLMLQPTGGVSATGGSWSASNAAMASRR